MKRLAFFLTLFCACNEQDIVVTTTTTSPDFSTDADSFSDSGEEPTGALTSSTSTSDSDGPPSWQCAFFVELNVGVSADAAHFVIDSTRCEDGQAVTLRLAYDKSEPADFDLGSPSACGSWGGAASVAESVVQMPIGPPKTAIATLLVDDMVAEAVRIPAVLQDLMWDEKPAIPPRPIHRAEDLSWRIIPDHMPGCDLLPTDGP